MQSKVGRLGVVVSLVLACDPEQAGDAEVEFRTMVENAPQLNSASLNGAAFNGFEINGWHLNGWHLNGWHLNGGHVDNVELVGTRFQGTQVVGGQLYSRSGIDFVGSELTLVREGQTFTLRFDAITPDPGDPTGETFFYAISARDDQGGPWASLCLTPEGDPTQAIPLKYWWDSATGDRIDTAGAITLACRGAVLAKCVEWNYRPWRWASRCDAGGQNCQQVSLQDHHQACTRMARADYCGDGRPYTVTGTLIDVFDDLSPRIQSTATAGLAAWGVEAEWGPDGAACVGASRRLHMLDELEIEYTTPACLTAIDDFTDCGALPTTRSGLLVNKFCESWTSDPGACQ